MTTDQREQHWKSHIEVWQQSELSQKTYCEQHQLSLATFGYWRKKLNRVGSVSKKLVPIAVSRSDRVTLTLPGNVCIETTSKSLADVLACAYHVLQTRNANAAS